MEAGEAGAAGAAVTALQKLPRHAPKTQSFYYMPLLTHAYYMVKKIEMTEILKNFIKSIKQLPLLIEERYTSILDGIVYCLKHNDENYIDMMEKSYRSDKPHNEHNIGHISGELQEKILQSSYISHTKYNLYFRHFNYKLHGEHKRIIKNLIDTMITCYYNKEICAVLYNEEVFFQKYLKYKNKYLH